MIHTRTLLLQLFAAVNWQVLHLAHSNLADHSPAPLALTATFPSEIGLLVGTLAQTHAGPEIKDANTDRLMPMAYGPTTPQYGQMDKARRTNPLTTAAPSNKNPAC